MVPYGHKDIIRDSISTVIIENFDTEKIRAEPTSEQFVVNKGRTCL